MRRWSYLVVVEGNVASGAIASRNRRVQASNAKSPAALLLIQH